MSRADIQLKKVEESLNVLDAMLVSLVEVLEKKQILSQEEWDRAVEARLREDRGASRTIRSRRLK